jgi:hypothetical protein
VALKENVGTHASSAAGNEPEFTLLQLYVIAVNPADGSVELDAWRNSHSWSELSGPLGKRGKIGRSRSKRNRRNIGTVCADLVI